MSLDTATMSSDAKKMAKLARFRRLAQEKNNPASTVNLLFVDDERRILNSLKAQFRLQYNVDIALDGDLALEMMKQKHYHLIVSDQRMPNLQGVELLRRAKILSPRTVRVLLTGFSDLAAIVGSVNEGEVYRYINKPWDNEELHSIVTDAVQIGLDLEQVHKNARPEPEKVLTSNDSADPPNTGQPISNMAGHQDNVEEITRSLTEGAPEIASAEHFAALGSILFIDHTARLVKVFKETSMIDCVPFSADSPEKALSLMNEHEIQVIVASIDGVDRANLGLLCLLKKEHPHITALAVAKFGDAETIIGLVNSARIFRVLFHPLRPNVLQHHLAAALKQADKLQEQPALMGMQHAKEVDESSSLLSGFSSSLKTRIKSVRNFFRRG